MCLRGEVGPDPEDLSAVGEEGPVVAFFVDLVQRVVGVFVALELQDIDEAVGLDEGVDAPVGGVALHLHLLADHPEHHVHSVLEVELVIAHNLVVHIGEEGREAAHQHFGVAGMDVFDKFIDRQAGFAADDRGVVIAEGIQKTVFHFFVGIHQRIAVDGLVITPDGQVAGLEQEGDDIGLASVDTGKVEGRCFDPGNIVQVIVACSQVADQK